MVKIDTWRQIALKLLMRGGDSELQPSYNRSPAEVWAGNRFYEGLFDLPSAFSGDDDMLASSNQDL